MITLRRSAATLGALFLFSGVAWANGREAATASLLDDPSSKTRLVLGVTFGLLVSEDDGATWRWTCEENIGYSGNYDPLYAVSPPGTIFAATEDGLRISRDHACSFGIAPEVEGRGAQDVTVGPTGEIWLAVTARSSDPSVFVSRDDGATFEPAGLGRLRTVWRALRVAPSNPERVYATGYLIPDAGGGGSTPLLYRREDDGSWTEIPFEAPGAVELAALAVDPNDEDVVFARVAGVDQDRLFRTENGGVSWTPVLTVDGKLTSVLLPDGARPGIALTLQGNGYRSTDGVAWTPTEAAPHGWCSLRRAGDQVLACGHNWAFERAALVTSDDHFASITPAFRFSEIAGALECPGVVGIHNDICVPTWPQVRDGLGRVFDGVPVDAIAAPDAPGPDDGGGGCGCGVALGVGLVGFFRPGGRRPHKGNG